MIRAFDKTGKGAVDFGEFYDLHVFILRTQASFESLLPNGSKHLPYEQVSQALQRAGFTLDEAAFNALFLAYDPTRRQALDMAEFLGVQLFLKAASGMFHVFDYTRAGIISLDFNQLVYAATFCR